MALKISTNTTQSTSIEQYLEYVRREVDLNDIESVAASAPMLRALANDRTLIIRRLNEQIQNWLGSGGLASGQSVLLGRGDNFYVRANIWPSSADLAGGRVYQDQFSYNIPHDHNFTFMTVTYSGPGYETDIYEYDYDKVIGHPGESVDIRFLERVRFSPGTVMLYRANRDIHIQYPPEEQTITLNLMISDREVGLRDQFVFDLTRNVISGFPHELDSSKRVSIVSMAGMLGDAEAHQTLSDLALAHPCRRTRLAAFEALCRATPKNVSKIWEQAAKDPAKLVTQAARKHLRAMEG